MLFHDGNWSFKVYFTGIHNVDILIQESDLLLTPVDEV